MAHVRDAARNRIREFAVGNIACDELDAGCLDIRGSLPLGVATGSYDFVTAPNCFDRQS
jgi:hypothetical protein